MPTARGRLTADEGDRALDPDALDAALAPLSGDEREALLGAVRVLAAPR